MDSNQIKILKGIRLICRYTLSLLVFISVSFSSQTNAQNKETDYILLINTYTESTLWSLDIIKPVMNLVSQTNKLNLYVENMNRLLVENQHDLEEYKHLLFKTYSVHKPRMVILVGFGSSILLSSIASQWGHDIPIIFCSEKDYIASDKKILERIPLYASDTLPISDLREKYNLAFIQKPVYPQENVDIMVRMLPQMKTFTFIGDETFISKQSDSELKNYIRGKYPQIKYRFISSEDIPTDSLFNILNNIDPQTDGLLFSSWFQKQHFWGNLFMLTNSYRITSTSPVPLFSLLSADIGTKSSIVGGYVNDRERYKKEIDQVINQILSGTRASEIPPYIHPSGVAVFNYENLVSYGLDPKLCPPGSIIYNKPPTFWEKYSYILIGGGIFLILIIVAFQYRRLRTLEKLRISQLRNIKLIEQYTNLINSMPVIYIHGKLKKNKDGIAIDVIIKDVNSYFEDTISSTEKVKERSIEKAIPDIKNDLIRNLNICLDENRSVTFSYYGNNTHIFYDIVMNVSEDKSLVNIFCIDSTELHNAQIQLAATNHKLAMALDVANIIPWRWDIKSKTVYYDITSRNQKKGIGDDKENHIAIPDKAYLKYINKEDRAKLLQAYHDLINGKTEKAKEEIRIIKDNITDCFDWIEIQAAIERRNENGKPTVLIGTSTVITERKMMEKDLMTAKENAEESNRLKSAFLANMSHEIRTPLNAIVGFSELLASTDDLSDRQEYYKIIENNNALLLQLISDILDLSKIEAGTLDFTYTDFDLNEMLKEQELSLKLKIGNEKSIKIAFDSSLQECIIHSEKNRLIQVILNLVSNAIKFTEKGEIRFGYTIENQMLHFFVSDTGCGIPPEKIQSIFGRFIKLNKFVPGTGLGLSICESIIKKMGGSITAESEINKGSTFRFTIPYHPVQKKDHESEDDIPEKVKDSDIVILVAEDNEYNYKLVESILKKEYTLIHAWNGREAVELYHKHNPKIILMDINMPEMDGYEATKEIRKSSTHIPIIAVTAFAFSSDEQRVMENEFNDYTAKPINANSLKKQIISNLQKHFIFL